MNKLILPFLDGSVLQREAEHAAIDQEPGVLTSTVINARHQLHRYYGEQLCLYLCPIQEHPRVLILLRAVVWCAFSMGTPWYVVPQPTLLSSEIWPIEMFIIPLIGMVRFGWAAGSYFRHNEDNKSSVPSCFYCVLLYGAGVYSKMRHS